MIFLQKCKRIPKHLPRLLQSALCLLLSFLLCDQCFGASLDSATLNFFNASDIHYYNPVGSKARNCYTGDINVAGGKAAEMVWSGLTSFMTEEQAAGIMGNMAHESNYFNPVQHEVGSVGGNGYLGHPNMDLVNDSTVNGYGIGLVQWSYHTRRQGFMKYIQSKNSNLLEYFFNRETYSVGYTIDGDKFIELAGEDVARELIALELEYVKYELENEYLGFYSTTTVDEAAQWIFTNYEGPRDNTLSTRTATAHTYYDQFKGKIFTNPGSSSTTEEDGSNVVIIGDSITVGAEAEIRKLLPEVQINAAVSRQFDAGVEILEQMTNPRDIIVFALGTNTDHVSQESAQKVINIAGLDRIVIFVNNFSLGAHDYAQNNLLFDSLAAENKNVFVADWENAVTSQPEGPETYVKNESGQLDVHPTSGKGNELFAQTIHEAVVGMNSRRSTLIDCIRTYNGEGVPQYFQTDEPWGPLAYGDLGIYGPVNDYFDTIAGSGCGPASFAMMITAILGQEITPADTADVAGKARMHVPGQGSPHSITAVLAQHYGVQYYDFSTSRSSCIGVIEAALADGWMIHTSGATGTGNNNPPFSSGGHYIGIVGVDADGNWMTADSAGWGNSAYPPQHFLDAGLKCDNLHGIKK